MLQTRLLEKADQLTIPLPPHPVGETLPMFDLSYVVRQLQTKPQFRRWTPTRFEHAVQGYQRFLEQARVNHKSLPVPNQDVDVIWHQHILNTKEYMADCNKYFGHYLHHTPRGQTCDFVHESTCGTGGACDSSS